MLCAPSPPGSETGLMSYFAFVTLMLADADKEHHSAIPFWFRVLDLDDDGVISRYEIQTVYRSMRQHLTNMGVEDALEFDDFYCQFLDMIRPASPPVIRLSDFKRCRQLHVALNMLVSSTRFLSDEEGQGHRDLDDDASDDDEDGSGGGEMSRWDKFADRQYEVLSSEEDYEGDDFDEY
jgi:serine/threonine-protein phosphatase 2A regulatory subunit B''